LEEQTREDALKELELILSAKQNINSITVTMYSIFFSLEGFLVFGFFQLTSLAGRLAIAAFGVLCLLALLLVTIRAHGTNDRCDKHAIELEKRWGFRVLSNYDNTEQEGWPRFAYRATMHGTLTRVDQLLIGGWIVMGVLAALQVV